MLHEDGTQQLLREAAYDQSHVTGAAASATVLSNKDSETHVETATGGMLEKSYLPSKEVRDNTLNNTAGVADFPEQERCVWIVRSTSLVVVSLMCTMWGKGVASCPVGGFDADAVLDTFDTDGEQYESVMLLTMGYPAEGVDGLQAEHEYHRPVDEVVYSESFESGQSTGPATADD